MRTSGGRIRSTTGKHNSYQLLSCTKASKDSLFFRAKAKILTMISKDLQNQTLLFPTFWLLQTSSPPPRFLYWTLLPRVKVIRSWGQSQIMEWGPWLKDRRELSSSFSPDTRSAGVLMLDLTVTTTMRNTFQLLTNHPVYDILLQQPPTEWHTNTHSSPATLASGSSQAHRQALLSGPHSWSFHYLGHFSPKIPKELILSSLCPKITSERPPQDSPFKFHQPLAPSSPIHFLSLLCLICLQCIYYPLT